MSKAKTVVVLLKYIVNAKSLNPFHRESCDINFYPLRLHSNIGPHEPDWKEVLRDCIGSSK
ncbi:hypothetical protein CVS40_6373 [Lucilia cuprina]|nr:hypothetical protein CVS40_6373 [Lucilia cuprina]